MRNKGFTLIEVMIVIAVLGIILDVKIEREIFRGFIRQESRILEQENIFMFQMHIKKLLKESKSLVKAVNRQVVFDNFKISVSKDLKRISVNGKIYEFDKFRFYGFEKSGDGAARLKVKNVINEYEIYLVAGNNKK